MKNEDEKGKVKKEEVRVLDDLMGNSLLRGLIEWKNIRI